ncbi:MAG: hypothetical protein N2C12_10600, partial [Planctomycetales bacterium]
LQNGLTIPLMTEYLHRENNQLLQAEGKQDSETTAFERLADYLAQEEANQQEGQSGQNRGDQQEFERSNQGGESDHASPPKQDQQKQGSQEEEPQDQNPSTEGDRSRPDPQRFGTQFVSWLGPGLLKILYGLGRQHRQHQCIA